MEAFLGCHVQDALIPERHECLDDILILKVNRQEFKNTVVVGESVEVQKIGLGLIKAHPMYERIESGEIEREDVGELLREPSSVKMISLPGTL